MERLTRLLTTVRGCLVKIRSPSVWLVVAGLTLIILTYFGSLHFKVSLPIFNGGNISIDSGSDGLPTVLIYLFFFLGVALLVSAVVREVCLLFFGRKKVIVVEFRGLRDSAGTPLDVAIPKNIAGRRESFLIDIRQGIHDGEVVDPSAALQRVLSVPIDLKRKMNGLDRRDLKLVFGALAPVPFTFLIGVLIDDECDVTLMDWDRHTKRWRDLKGTDDGARFTCTGIDNVDPSVVEVALKVSVSYEIFDQDVQAKVANIPMVSLLLENGSLDSHWSEEKQRSLGEQFINTIMHLGNNGVEKIHLFLAAPNSVTFRFGALYDKRNFPNVIVYQYQPGSTRKHTWGILMPVRGNSNPEIITDNTT
ncbi:MAG: SAVED domain-containing protein [Gammaproteobacteria bacterium]|nr:SAVED domain-containing protein [Gammaproteobacteria bacterium]